jgi:hypothetical protein
MISSSTVNHEKIIGEVDKMVRVTQSAAVQKLGDVAEDKQFWCQNGQFFKNLPDMEVAFGGMGDDTFRYHASAIKNDFSNWVRDVIGDEKLARDLQRSATPAKAKKAVAGRIAWLRSKI